MVALRPVHRTHRSSIDSTRRGCGPYTWETISRNRFLPRSSQPVASSTPDLRTGRDRGSIRGLSRPHRVGSWQLRESHPGGSSRKTSPLESLSGWSPGWRISLADCCSRRSAHHADSPAEREHRPLHAQPFRTRLRRALDPAFRGSSPALYSRYSLAEHSLL